MGRIPEPIRLKAADRRELQRWLRSRNTTKGVADRARAALLLDDGLSVGEVAARVDVDRTTLYKWRRRYAERGLDGLVDGHRSGRPTKITPEIAERILTMTVERIPREATHWSIRLMADAAGVTRHQVQEVWKAADLKPHRLRTFKISNDPRFAEKVIDVVGLYMNPPENAMVLSVDEKTQVQALDRTQPMLPLREGQIERRTHDYKRHGTASLYAAFDIASGEVIGRITSKHRAKEFLAFLRQLDRSAPAGVDLHLILDNSSTHSTPAVKAWLGKHSRFKLHFTPTSASWLNAVEGWFAQLERRALHRGVFSSVGHLREEIRRYIKVHNDSLAKPFKWTKTAKSILAKVGRARQALEQVKLPN